jgi:hypothetical protein
VQVTTRRRLCNKGEEEKSLYRVEDKGLVAFQKIELLYNLENRA